MYFLLFQPFVVNKDYHIVLSTTQPPHLLNLISDKAPVGNRSLSLVTLTYPSTSSSLYATHNWSLFSTLFTFLVCEVWNQLTVSLCQPHSSHATCHSPISASTASSSVDFSLLSFTTPLLFLHCKNIGISTDILWKVFHIFTEPVLYTFASTDWLNNVAWAHIAMRFRASLFHRFTDTNVYGTGSVKMRKTRHKISVDIQIFYSVPAYYRNIIIS